MNRIIKLTLSIAFCLVAMIAQAETFYLLDGNKVTGQIVSHEDGIYTVTTSFGIVDIPENNIDRISDKAEEVTDEIKEISIVTNETKHEFTPEYEDEKYHDPYYISYSQAKTSAVALTASGSVILGLSVLSTVIALPVYFGVRELVFSSGLNGWIKSLIGIFNSEAAENLDTDELKSITDSVVMSIMLPALLVPGVVGFCLVMACIGPWIYASKMLQKWQSKYHVFISSADTSSSGNSSLTLGMSISL